MKLIKKILLSIILMVCSTLPVYAKDSLTCDTKVEQGDIFNCNVTIEGNAKTIEVDSGAEIIKLDDEENKIDNLNKATFNKSGKISIRSNLIKGNHKVTMKDSDNKVIGSPVTILITKKETTTTTTTTTKHIKSTNNYLDDILVDGESIESFNPDNKIYTIMVPRDTETINIEPVLADTSASVKVDGPLILKDENIFTIRVTSEDNTSRFYKVKVFKEAEEVFNTNLSKFEIKNHNFNFNNKIMQYDITLNPNETKLDILVKAEDDNTSIDIIGNKDLKEGSTVKVVVSAGDMEEVIYEIHIHTKEAERNTMSILYISLLVVAVIAIIVIVIIANKNKKDKNSKNKKENNENKEEVTKDVTSDTIDISDIQKEVEEESTIVVDENEVEDNTTEIDNNEEVTEEEITKELDDEITKCFDDFDF